MKRNTDVFFRLEDLAPSLRLELESQGLDLKKMIRVAMPIKKPDEHPKPVPDLQDRRKLILTDGKLSCRWEAESLRALFRGNNQPPALGDYPVAYNDAFMMLDFHALEFSRFFGDRRDTEMLEIYSCLRRRPDGKSMGLLHDYMWQAAAFMLATRPLS